jgi:ferredoxin
LHISKRKRDYADIKKGGVSKMARKIDKDVCVGCGSCASTCPVEAIAPDGDKYAVDASKCVDCGACESGCPVSAIKAE